MRTHRRLRLVLVSTTILLSPALASAQSASPIDRMNSIEAQIRSLQNELRSMRNEANARDRELRAAQREAAQARQEANRAQQTAAAQPGRPAPSGAPASGIPNLSPQGGASGSAASTTVAGNQLDASQQNASTTPKATERGSFDLGGGITVTLGGFVEAAGIFRTRNEVADISSNFNTGIPFPQSPNYHQTEFRGSAHQSRVSLLVTGTIDPTQKLASYVETDFQSAAPTANSNESNSYNLRLRQFYGAYDNTSLGLHVLGGQAWSLLTPFKVGITPRSEDLPPVIDAQYAVGFTWARQPQARIVGDFADHKLWAGLSLESPQTVYSVGPNGAGVTNKTVTTSTVGGSGLDPTANYSSDVAPDLIAKVAYDAPFGHFEALGLGRLMRDRVSVIGGGTNKTVVAGGIGGSTNIPLIKDKLEFHANVLAGYGIGRYGSAQLPDATIGSGGAPRPLPEVEALAGLILHPVPSVDVYGYGGIEAVSSRSFTSGGKGYGYGSPLYVNTGCYVELSASPCQANTSSVTEGTIGAWWRVLKGNFGTAQVGAQYEYLHRSVFNGVGGSRGTDDNMVLISLRYLPFQ
jgi:outer membrane murein-binding lipoprotein Lpp